MRSSLLTFFFFAVPTVDHDMIFAVFVTTDTTVFAANTLFHNTLHLCVSGSRRREGGREERREGGKERRETGKKRSENWIEERKEERIEGGEEME